MACSRQRSVASKLFPALAFDSVPIHAVRLQGALHGRMLLFPRRAPPDAIIEVSEPSRNYGQCDRRVDRKAVREGYASMPDVDLPSLKEQLWQKMQGDLAKFIPDVVERNRLMCCACGRFLPPEHFDVDHM